MIFIFRKIIPLLTLILSISSYGQQVVDSSFIGNIGEPAYEREKGPKILIDEVHNNGTRLKSSFAVLSKVLIKDGYNLQPQNQNKFEHEILNLKVLVIIDPLATQNIDKWELPTPSAFDKREIKAINKFVKKGGSLLLVVDHMPFSGASQKLAQSFGVDFINGFAIDTVQWDLTKFNRNNNSLKQHAIINGRNYSEKIFEIGSYFGQCFTYSNSNLVPLLEFTDKNIVCYEPKKAWRFDSKTKIRSALGLYQGIAGEYGKGRIVILGDSSFVGAYLIGQNSRPIGMNSIEVKDNFQFILNIFHWLSRLY